jgi:hypothetical protein
MNRNLIVFGAVALLAGWVFAQAQDEPYDFRDLKGNLRLWNSDDWSREDDDDGNTTILATGKPAKAESKNQGLTLNANRIEAFLKNQGKGQLAFEWADLQGNVTVHQVRKTSDGTVTRDLETQKLKLNEGKDVATTTLSVPFTLIDDLKPSGGNRPRTLFVKASNGTLVTDPYQKQNENEIKSADLHGATVKLTQGEKPGEKEPTKSVSTAISNSIDIKKLANYTLTFNSKVDFTDDRDIKKEFGPATQNTTMAGNSGTITLDDLKADGDQPVVSANLEGNIKLTFKSVNPIKDDVEYTDITVTGDHLTFDRATRTIHITGNVVGNYIKKKKTTKEEDILPYQLKGDDIEIVLTEDFSKVKSVRGKNGTARTGGAGG